MDDTPVAAHSPRLHDPIQAGTSRLALIAAMARNRVIGADNRMPWHVSSDLKRFRLLTTGHSIIMGRKTFESMGKPLPGRENIIVSRNRQLEVAGCRVVDSIDAALRQSTMPPPAFCIGGAELYISALPFATEIYLTEIDADFVGDTLMPEIPAAEWRESSRESGSDPASGLHLAFVHLVRVEPKALATPPTIPN